MTNFQEVNNIELTVGLTWLLRGGIATSLTLSQIRGNARFIDSSKPAAITYRMDVVLRLIRAHYFSRTCVGAYTIGHIDHFNVFKLLILLYYHKTN